MNIYDHLKELKTAQSSSHFTDNNNAAKNPNYVKGVDLCTV